MRPRLSVFGPDSSAAASTCRVVFGAGAVLTGLIAVLMVRAMLQRAPEA